MTRQITQEQISEQFKLYDNRVSMIQAVGKLLHKNPIICELGVGLGDFSQKMIEFLKPSFFTGVDTFSLHGLEYLFGRKTSDIFQGSTHYDFYINRVTGLMPADNLEVLTCNSNDFAIETKVEKFDLIYIDADHSYISVKNDLNASLSKIKKDGVIVLNDYTFYDPVNKSEYGVVLALNEFLLENHDFQIICMSLEPNMFCDLAIMRKKTNFICSV